MKPEIDVVIPTKNEEGNIEPLFRKLMALKLDMKIIFINDASTDRTGKIEENLKKKYHGRVDVVHRGKSCGLGKALLNGYEHALKSTNAKFIAQMDGDGQHDPAYLPRMIEAAKHNADIVLGSRYMQDGSLGEWDVRRKLTSWSANLLVKRALRGLAIHDATTGYRVFRREMLEKIIKSDMGSSGYVFQIETLANARKAGASVTEVPIYFKPRMSGNSKLKFSDKKEFFMFALRNML